jgi:hypothetical protein
MIKNKILFGLRYFFSGLTLLFGILSGSAGAYIFVSQVGLFLKSGYWVELPLIYLLKGFSPAVLPEKVLQHLGTLSNPFAILEINNLLVGSNSLQEWLSEPHAWSEVHGIVVQLLESIPISMFLLVFSALLSLSGLSIMSSIREKMDERPFKKKEPADRGTTPCGICGQRVRANKYQSHWARCFLRKEKNKAKVKGRNN